MLEPGTVVDRYRIEAVVASGGMATVYRVRHTQLGSVHALKVLDLPSEALKERLMLEGQLQARLNHPNLVRVTDVVPVAGAFGLVMEFVDGPTLDAWIEAGPKPGETVDERIADTERVFRGILSAVSYAHRKGLVHRDLKPQNVLLEDQEGVLNPKVLDFGIAKLMQEQKAASLTRTGWGMGTPEYMAPEQLKAAKDVDARADIWALGCILYAMYAGKSPFAREDLLQTFAALGTGEHAPLDSVQPAIPARIVNAVRACLHVSRELRVADCSALSMILTGTSAAAPDPTTEERKASYGSPPKLAANNASQYPSEPAQSADRDATGASGLNPAQPLRWLTPAPPTPAPLTRSAPPAGLYLKPPPLEPSGREPSGPEPSGPEPSGPEPSEPERPPAPSVDPATLSAAKRAAPDTMEYPPAEDDTPEEADRTWIAYGVVLAGLLGGACTLVALVLWARAPVTPEAPRPLEPAAATAVEPPAPETTPEATVPAKRGVRRSVSAEAAPAATLRVAAEPAATEASGGLAAPTDPAGPGLVAEGLIDTTAGALEEPSLPQAQPEVQTAGAPLSDPAEITRMVKRVFDKHTDQISACYQSSTPAGPGAGSGDAWKISLVVERDGSPSAIAARSETSSLPAVEGCMTAVVAKFRFSPLAEPQPYARTITFVESEPAPSEPTAPAE
ncbi:MAG: serine/threonine protein kinase [Myxococcales bacterium]|nr:serine/threonine protein kinase [Myxococcales bacterium]